MLMQLTQKLSFRGIAKSVIAPEYRRCCSLSQSHSGSVARVTDY